MSSKESAKHRHKIKEFSLKKKPSKVKLLQTVSRRVSCKDIIETCKYVMKNVKSREKIDPHKIEELQKFILLFNEKL